MGNGLFLLLENKYYILRKDVYYIYATERSERSILSETPKLIKIKKITVEEDGRFCVFFNIYFDSQNILWTYTEELNSFLEINATIIDFIDRDKENHNKSLYDRFYGSTANDDLRDLVDACVADYDEFLSYNKEVQNYLK